MSKTIKTGFMTSAIFFVLSFVACSGDDSKDNKQKVISSTVILYQDSEPGLEPYTTRYIVNEKYMRIDDGKPDSGFVLLDRKKNIVYSVSVENESILVIKPTEIKIKRPKDMKTSIVDKPAPKKLQLEGKPSQEIEIYANKKLCSRMITVKGVLPDYVAALKQYRSILASQHATNLFKTPVNMRDNCFMAYDIFEHGLHTARGLIVRKWIDKGKQTMLADYRLNQKASVRLFVMPEKYKKFKAGLVP